MGKNFIRKRFEVDGSWTCPAGVTEVRVLALNPTQPMTATGSSIIYTNGQLYTWGYGLDGILGDGQFLNRSVPSPVLGGYQFKSAARFNSALAITPSGKAYAWGKNAQGQLGDGTIVPKSSPVAVSSSVVFDRPMHSVGNNQGAITAAGVAYTWGDNTLGELGDNSITPKSTPVVVAGSLSWKSVVFGDRFAIGLRDNGAAYGWGGNTIGQLGDNTIVNKSSPVAVVGGLTFAQVAAASLTGAGITTSGAAYCWGDNSQGQLGNNNFSVARVSSPVAVVGGLTFAQSEGSLAANLQTFAAITPAGDLYTWGYSNNSLLGDNTQVLARSSPVLVAGGLKYKKVYPLFWFSGFVAETISGSFYSWGGNSSAQIGDGTLTNRSSPVLVSTNSILTPQQQFLAECIFKVTPGTAYPITTNGLASFNGKRLRTDLEFPANHIYLEYYL